MPITKSAKKALRQNRRKRVFNLRRNRKMKSSLINANMPTRFCKNFHMEGCKSSDTLMQPRVKYCKDDGAAKVNENHYRCLIGCLIYLTASRPDIVQVVSLLSRFMHCASEKHLQAAKRIIRYI